MSFPDSSGQTIVERFTYQCVCQGFDLTFFYKGVGINDVCQTSGDNLISHLLLEFDLIVCYFVDVAIVRDEIDDTIVFLPNLKDLSFYMMLFSQVLECQGAVGFNNDFSEEVITTRPNITFRVAKYDGKTTEAWRVKYAPSDVVVIKQTFEVGHIDDTVLVNIQVEVHGMRLIVICIEMTHERQSLGQSR